MALTQTKVPAELFVCWLCVGRSRTSVGRSSRRATTWSAMNRSDTGHHCPLPIRTSTSADECGGLMAVCGSCV